MKNKKLIFPIREKDVKQLQELVVYNAEEEAINQIEGGRLRIMGMRISWTLKTECGEPIDIEFVKGKRND
jgi:hypothetical protein